jgi:hypothetical protein
LDTALLGLVHCQPNRLVSLYLHSFTVSQNKKDGDIPNYYGRRGIPYHSPSSAATTSASSA